MNTEVITALGYTWLALPREDILPLMLLEKTSEGFFRRMTNSILGIAPSAEALPSDIFDLFPEKTEKGSYPKCNAPKLSTAFSGEDIVSKNSGFMFSGKEEIFDLANAELMSELSKVKKLRYSFKAPQVIDTNIIKVEQHLNVNSLNDKAAGFAEKVKMGALYVITEVLQTKEFSVRDGSSLKVDAKGEIKVEEEKVGALKANASIDSDSSDSNKLVYKNERAVTFALKAFKIFYNKNTEQYSLSKEPIRIVRSEEDNAFDSEGLNTPRIEALLD